MHISVVITITEKDKKHLRKCLLSIKHSAKFAKATLEFIIVCNGITISSPRYLESDFKIVKNKVNLGFGQATNIGMKFAKNDWCIILAPDTIANKNTLANLLKHINKPHLAILTPKIHFPYGLDFNLNPFPSLWTIFLEQSYLYKTFKPMFRLPNSDFSLYTYIHEVDAAASTFWLIKKKIFFKVGGFDKRFFLFFDDTDLCWKLKILGKKILFVPDSTILHLGHQSSGGIARGDLFIYGLWLYLTKHFSLIYSVLAIMIFYFGSFIRFMYWYVKLLLNKRGTLANLSISKLIFYKSIFRFTPNSV